MNASEKGGIAELAIAAEAAKLGIPVLRPMTEALRYDLAFDLGRRVARVQCKWAVLRGDVVEVKIRTHRRTRDGFATTTYTSEEVDYVAAYCAELDRCYALPISLVGGRTAVSLRLAPARNGQRAGLHFADEYTLGAIAQLEEHLAGSEGVVGSSPTSSTPSLDRAAGTVIGAHEFRNRFGWYMERAAAGEPIVVTRRGKPHLRLSPAAPRLGLAA